MVAKQNLEDFGIPLDQIFIICKGMDMKKRLLPMRQKVLNGNGHSDAILSHDG